MSHLEVITELVRNQSRALKMPGMAKAFEGRARQGREQAWSYEEYLHQVLAAEQESRAESAVKHRLRFARFPELKTPAGFDFSQNEGISPGKMAELARGDWINRRENVILAGPIGTGKTHLAIALGAEAARRRHHVLFWRTADLVQALIEARDQRELSRLQ